MNKILLTCFQFLVPPWSVTASFPDMMKFASYLFPTVSVGVISSSGEELASEDGQIVPRLMMLLPL